MHRKGHIGAALLAHAPLAFVATLAGADEFALIGAVAAGGLAMAPDIDLRVPGLSHRGITHTVWFAAAIGLTTGAAAGLIGTGAGAIEAIALATFGGLIGTGTIFSHIAADALTPAGVRPLAPWDNRHLTYDVVRAANPVANYALLAIGFITAVGAVALANAARGAIGF